MLYANLCVQFGLFSGATVIVFDIIYSHGHTNDTLPDVVLVEFSKYSGPACSCKGCTRKQIPLRLGWASTIHRCQGMTIGSGIHCYSPRD